MKTVLITGCSSGYGLATARFFLAKGWQVIATMRTVKPELFPASDALRLIALDITRAESIAAALAQAGPVDVLVNNAGIGAFGAFEATPMPTVREMFETNTFGTMAMTQAVLPQFRAQGHGLIINVTSSATLAPMPLVAPYTASKTAVEGFTASLALELAELKIGAKMVIPGYAPSTQFIANGAARMEGLITAPYAAYANRILTGFATPAATTSESDVAEVVYEAATDGREQLRYPAGPDAVALATMTQSGNR